jgi:hypothetical protein
MEHIKKIIERKTKVYYTCVCGHYQSIHNMTNDEQCLKCNCSEFISMRTHKFKHLH